MTALIAPRVQLDTAALDALVARLQDRAADWRPAWPIVGAQWWATRTRTVFDTSGRGRWAPLASSTVVEKRRIGATGGPLVRTGTLLRDVADPAPRKSEPRFAVYGQPPVAYAIFHARGRGVPRRSPVPAPTIAERRQIAAILLDHLARETRAGR